MKKIPKWTQRCSCWRRIWVSVSGRFKIQKTGKRREDCEMLSSPIWSRRYDCSMTKRNVCTDGTILWNHWDFFVFRSETGHFDVNVVRDTEMPSCEFLLCIQLDNSKFLFVFDSVRILVDKTKNLQRNMSYDVLWRSRIYLCCVRKELTW